MREAMQESALVGMFLFQHDVAISTARGSCDNVLVEGERDEYDDGEEVDGCADGAHAFGDFNMRRLAEVATAEAGAHKGRAKPADHGVAEAEGEDGEGERGDEWFAIALEGIEEDGERGAGEDEEGEGFGAGEGCR